MNVARRIGENMAAAVAGKAVVAAVGVVTVAIMTRRLGVADYGILRTALTFVLFPATCANLGLNYILLREVELDPQGSDRIVGAALGLRLTAAAMFLGLGFAVALLIPWSTTVRLAILIASVGMTAWLGNEILTAVLQWRLRQEAAALAEVVGTVATLAGAALVAKLGFGVLAMTAVSTGGLFVTFVLAWMLAKRVVPLRVIFDARIWMRLIRPGLPLAASAWLLLVSMRGDTLVLSLLKPAEDVGLYGVATKIYEVGLQLPFLFGGLLMPMFARAAGDPAKLRMQISYALNAVVVAGIGMSLGLAFFATDIVILLAGPAFVPSAPAVRIAGVSLALGGCSAVLRYAVVAQDKQVRLMMIDAAVSVAAVLLYIVLISKLSFIGAAVGTLIVEVLMIASLLTLLGRGLGTIPWPAHLVRTLLAGLLTAGGAFLLRLSPMPALAAGAIAFLVYAGSLWITGAVSQAQVRALLLPRP
jgi:O-antigen/teichoic acid export membrane protein